MKAGTDSPVIVYFAEADSGGIAEYAIYHSAALSDAGARVVFLCRPSFPHQRLDPRIQAHSMLPARHSGRFGKLSRLFNYIRDSRRCAAIAARMAVESGADALLMDCFREYLAPFWTGPLIHARRRGVRMLVVAHDPVRDFVVGPLWWHRACIRSVYRCMHDVFVHDATRVDFGGPQPPWIRVHEVPHGPYSVPPPARGRAAVRAELGFHPDDVVVLSFGQIRDGKNLDACLQALALLPANIKLLVAGRGDSASQKPPEFYQQLSSRLGVGDRCRWLIRYVGDTEMGDLFDASDICLLTYSKAFVSASGVLNTSVQFQLPMLASGGDGPLRRIFENYVLGKWIHDVSPRSVAAALEGPWPDRKSYEFDRYTLENSWQRNACILLGSLDGPGSSGKGSSCPGARTSS